MAGVKKSRFAELEERIDRLGVTYGKPVVAAPERSDNVVKAVELIAMCLLAEVDGESRASVWQQQANRKETMKKVLVLLREGVK